ncbi:MAG TPA: zinc-binding dehydrogenase [Acidimicrobiales bacterium]
MAGPGSVRAATLLGPEKIEVRSYSRLEQAELGDDWGLLRVEACGLCGTDVEQFHGGFVGSTWPAGPVVPGHEVVGVVESVGPEAAARWGVAPGDRVAVEPNLPCGTCAWCLSGRYVSCQGWSPAPMAYGFIPVAHPPGLWGGWSELMVLHPRSVVHRVPDGLDAGTAALFNAFANGFRWATTLAGLRYGQSVLVLGAGQRGLACVAAARAAGAGLIVATGRSTDAHRLEAARALGADVTVDVDAAGPAGDVEAAVREATGGALVDVAIDASAGATAPVLQALACVRPEGTVVLAGLKGGRTVDGVPVDDLVLRGLRVVGARSADFEAYEQALAYLAAATDRVAPLRTHELPLDRAETALRVLAGEAPDEHPIYVSLRIP